MKISLFFTPIKKGAKFEHQARGEPQITHFMQLFATWVISFIQKTCSFARFAALD